MNIGIDISQGAYEGTGVGRYTIGLVESILDNDTENTWTFLFCALRSSLPSRLVRKIKESRHRLVTVPIPPTLLSFLWNTLHIIPVETFTGKLDFFITSDWTEPPTRCKKMTVIHDLVYLTNPETVHESILSTQKKRMEWVKKESSHIISTSDTTKNEIVRLLSTPPSKITTVYTGISYIATTDAMEEALLKQFNLKAPYILTVGKVEPRKNIARLIEAFSELRRDDLQLVVVGPSGWDTVSKTRANDRIVFTGFVTDSQLHALYERCVFFAFPSLAEGFGHPVIEAMKHRRAVLASKVPALVEITAGKALFCDPYSVTDIADKLKKLLDDGDVRKEVAEEGFEYAKQFTWKRFYGELEKVISKYA